MLEGWRQSQNSPMTLRESECIKIHNHRSAKVVEEHGRCRKSMKGCGKCRKGIERDGKKFSIFTSDISLPLHF